MGKASRKKRQQDSQAESILNGKSLISSEISSKWSLFNKPIVHFFLIAIVGFLVYSNTFHVPFHFDDTPNIVENYKLRDLSNFWPPSGSRWFGFFTFALNYHFGGLNTIGYHVVNLAIHIFNAILVYWLVILTFRTPYFSASNPPSPPRRVESPTFSKGGMGFALFSALLFVAHPIQTQAVTYIVQRFTSLATFFYLLSLVMYIKWRESKGQRAEGEKQQAMSNEQRVKSYAPSAMLYALSIISAILAMKTKEIAFTLPIVITLYEFMFFEGKFKKRLLYLIPLLFTMLIIPLSIIGIDKPIGDAIGELEGASQETEEISRWSYLFTQFRVIVTYIRLLFFPINQNLDYDYPIYHSFFNPEVFLSLLFLLLIFAFGIYLLYSKRYPLSASRFLAFGIFWFFITLSVESSIIPIRDVIFEHRLYLLVIGIIIIFVSATFYILQAMIQNPKRSLTTCYLLLASAVIVLSIATYQRNIIWKDEVRLWEDVVRKSPNKTRGYNNIGNAYRDKGLIDKAIEHYLIALSLKPDYADAHYNLGLAYYEQEKFEKKFEKAIEAFQTALKLRPDYADTYNNLGSAYYKQGRLDEAMEAFQTAIRLKPDLPMAHNNIGLLYARKGMLEGAMEAFQTAIRLKPDYANAHYNLGVIYEKQGLIYEAIKHYRIASRLEPEDTALRDQVYRILQIKR